MCIRILLCIYLKHRVSYEYIIGWIFIYLEVLFFKKNYLFILGEKGRRRGRERIPSRLPTEHRAQCRAQPHVPGIMTWVETKLRMLNWLSHPGAPSVHFRATPFPDLFRIFTITLHYLVKISVFIVFGLLDH